MQTEPTSPTTPEAGKRKNLAVAIKDAPERIPKGVRKPVPSMLMRNAGGLRIKVLHRRAMNCLLAHAQMQDRLGIEPGEHGYEIPIADFESMLGFSSNGNRTFIVELLEELTRINIKFDDAFCKGAMTVINHVVYQKSSHVVTYSIDSVAKSMFLRPERFAYLNIRLMQSFTSLAALMIFEYCSAFSTSPGKRTPEFAWADWSVLMSGAPEPHSTIREFNKILTRAVAQVNNNWTECYIEANVVKIGGRLKSLWFSVLPKAQTSLELNGNPTAVSGPLRDQLVIFGLTQHDIEQLLLVHDEDYLFAQAEYLTKRMTKPQASQVDSPPSFFRAAVESNYANVSREHVSAPSTPQLKLTNNQDKPPTLSSHDQWWSGKYAEARSTIEAMTAKEKSELLERFKEGIACSLPSVVRSIKQHGVGKPVGLAVLSRLLAHSLYTEPGQISSQS